MNWYKIAQLQGEWWIINGQSIAADGDIGDMNHEGYVIDHIQRKYAYDKFAGEYVNWDGFLKELAKEAFAEQAGERFSSQTEWDRYAKNIDLKKYYMPKLKEFGMTDEEMAVINGRGDARDYGMKYLGWKRVKQNNIQTQTLTHEDLQDIARGIGDAYQDDLDDNTPFNIEVNATKTLYENIPLSMIESGNPSELSAYRNQYARADNWHKTAFIDRRSVIQVEGEVFSCLGSG